MWRPWLRETGFYLSRGCVQYNAASDEGECMTMNMSLTAVFLKVPEGYIGFVEELPGANTQGLTEI